MVLHIAVLLLLVGLLPLVALIPVRMLASLSARRHARRERAEIAALTKQSSLHTVKGVLRVEGPIEQKGHGRALGAFTIWSSARRFAFRRPKFEGRGRAEKLVVIAGAQRYELEGDVEVLAGTRTVFRGTRAEAFDRKAFAVQTCLFEGDEVTVAGVVTRAASGKEYRDRGATVLEPSPESGVIVACASKAPLTVVPIKALWRHASVIPLMLLACVPLYKLASEYSETECRDACVAYGKCEIMSYFQARDLDFALNRLRRGKQVGCSATSDAQCRGATTCREDGQCTAKAGVCAATAAEDCRRTEHCINTGWCSPTETGCRALVDEDCRYTEGCISLGRCSPRDGFCEVTDESCRANPDCGLRGNCAAIKGICAAARTEDCATTEACMERGECTPLHGSCAVGSDADCRTSRACREYGKCSLREGWCVATSKEDCRDSRRCASSRACDLLGNNCGADAPSCRQSIACSYWGHCDGTELCSASSKKDCEAAVVCKGKPDCRLLAGSCAADCRDTLSCKRYGSCAPKGKDGCAATTDAECTASEVCREIGFCSLSEGRCDLTSSADCARSDGCKRSGRCSYGKDICQHTDADCAATEACKRLGQCTSNGFRCELKSAAECERSEACAKFGWCGLVRLPFTIAEQCGPPGMVKAR